MKIGLAIEALAAAEQELAGELTAVGERHRTDHDVFHLTGTLARMETGHLDALAPHAERYDADLDGRRETADEEPGEGSEPGLLLLRDLRRLHVCAAGVSLDWVALGQAAQAARDTDLLATVTACHPETLRTLKWTTYRLKEAAPQVLTS